VFPTGREHEFTGKNRGITPGQAVGNPTAYSLKALGYFFMFLRVLDSGLNRAKPIIFFRKRFIKNFSAIILYFFFNLMLS
jgi:hypothetical protein